MATHNANIGILEAAYRGWNASKGDPGYWFDIVAPEIKLNSLGGGETPLEFTATRQGAEQLKVYLVGLLADWRMNFQNLKEIIADGDRLCAIVDMSWTNKRTAKTFEGVKVDIWRFKDGKAVEFQEFYDTARAMAAAR
jgi:uncharacterized protein